MIKDLRRELNVCFGQLKTCGRSMKAYLDSPRKTMFVKSLMLEP